jgi:hypothetical protein
VIPNPASTNIDTSRRLFAEIPDNWTKLDKKSVKKTKLATNPVTTPRGFCLLPSAEDKIIGSKGKIQGDKTVTTPAKKAKTIRNIISWKS